MRNIALVLACLIFVCVGRRMLRSEEQLFPDHSGHALPVLSTLLLSMNPSLARNHLSPRPRTIQHQPRISVWQGEGERNSVAELRMNDNQPGALAKVGDAFEEALNAMPPDEKYNSVLMSLLAKSAGNMEASLDLVREMSSKRYKLSTDAVKKLVDQSVEKGNIEDILETFGAACDNGACPAFASRQIRLPPKPKPNILNSLTEVPTDDRSTEVTVALAFAIGAAVLTVDELANILDFWDVLYAPPLGYVFLGLVGGWAGDRYANQGGVSDLIGRGLNRLFSQDLQRETSIESASFLIGYLLGLPCCAFSPTATKPLEMLTSAGQSISSRIGGSSRLVDRVLIWLMAASALEMSEYKETARSDPSLGLSFLQAARRREANIGVDVQEGEWTADQDDERVRWAYSEARRLLQQNSGTRQALQEKMAAGASAGDCVAFVEDRTGNTWARV